MRDISLHLLDLAQNSITAGASLVEIMLALGEDHWLTLSIKDDGKGMDTGFLQQVQNPFVTSRTTRKVGLGIPLITANAQLSGGDVHLDSQVGQGTFLKARFNTNSIDCLPLGDFEGTILSLVIANPEKPDFLVEWKSSAGTGSFDTRMIRQVLQGVPLNEPEIIAWIKQALNEEFQPIFGGVLI